MDALRNEDEREYLRIGRGVRLGNASDDTKYELEVRNTEIRIGTRRE